MARETSKAVLACILMLLLAAVAGCSDFEFWGKPEKKAVDPNAYPEDYKKDVLAYVKTHPGELLNAREASITVASAGQPTRTMSPMPRARLAEKLQNLLNRAIPRTA